VIGGPAGDGCGASRSCQGRASEDITEHEIRELDNLLEDIHSALYGSAQYPLDVDTAENLSDRTLSAITSLKERRGGPDRL